MRRRYLQPSALRKSSVGCSLGSSALALGGLVHPAPRLSLGLAWWVGRQQLQVCRGVRYCSWMDAAQPRQPPPKPILTGAAAALCLAGLLIKHTQNLWMGWGDRA